MTYQAKIQKGYDYINGFRGYEPPISGNTNINTIIERESIMTRRLQQVFDKDPYDDRIAVQVQGLWVYLRDNFEVQTMGEALDVLSKAKVPEEVIDYWLTEGYTSGEFIELLLPALLEGYPLSNEEIIAHATKRLDELGRILEEAELN